MVERLYPGVYVTEIASQAKPIEGVATSTAHAVPLQATDRHTRLPLDATPGWTQHNDSDPGVTLMQLFAWLSESTLFSTPLHPTGSLVHLPAGWGVVQGLAVDDPAPAASGKLQVSPGLALTNEGKPSGQESSTDALRVKKP